MIALASWGGLVEHQVGVLWSSHVGEHVEDRAAAPRYQVSRGVELFHSPSGRRGPVVGLAERLTGLTPPSRHGMGTP